MVVRLEVLYLDHVARQSMGQEVLQVVLVYLLDHTAASWKQNQSLLSVFYV